MLSTLSPPAKAAIIALLQAPPLPNTTTPFESHLACAKWMTNGWIPALASTRLASLNASLPIRRIDMPSELQEYSGRVLIAADVGFAVRIGNLRLNQSIAGLDPQPILYAGWPREQSGPPNPRLC